MNLRAETQKERNAEEKILLTENSERIQKRTKLFSIPEERTC